MLDERFTYELEAFGKRVRSMRKSKGMSQLDLALAVSKDRSEISKIENGKLNIEFLTIVKIGLALDSELSDLFSQTRRPALHYPKYPEHDK